MLAETVGELEKLRYPKLLSPKLDGIRCVKVDGKALSRKFKQIPNKHVREWVEKYLPDGIDGELTVPGTSFNEIQSAIMSHEGKPNFVFHAFDYVNDLEKPFITRFNEARTLVIAFQEKYPDQAEKLVIVPHYHVNDEDEVMTFEKQCFENGFEGVMLRCPLGPYKEGRSTVKEEFLLKIKRWEDSEGVVTGFEEQEHNENKAEVNELGLTKRSSKKAGKVPANTLGKFIVTTVEGKLPAGKELKVGTGEGMTKALRKEIWLSKETYLGKTITFKYQPFGMKEDGLPRFPIWKGFRHSDDT